MGGGGLRILPHKSWHVWNFDNREKVRKDEAQAKIDEAEKQSRAEAADQEARLAILRKNAGLPPLSQHADETSHVADGSTSKRRRIEGPQRNDNVYENDGGKVALANNRHNLGTEDEDSYPALGTSSGAARHHRGKLQHINFFEDIEKKQNKRNGPNADKARDKKKEEEAHLKKIGALVYVAATVTCGACRGQVGMGDKTLLSQVAEQCTGGQWGQHSGPYCRYNCHCRIFSDPS
eukprot:m.579180 g.579180  ORF g.579180 m.579180 type:complete len:235 (+) comp22314_c0_seq3:286-990(+)